jgi:hypothetical protein
MNFKRQSYDFAPLPFPLSNRDRRTHKKTENHSILSGRAQTSVADTDLNPDPHVFGPPGSGSISQRYGSGSGSGSFNHHAKIVRKTLIPTIL